MATDRLSTPSSSSSSISNSIGGVIQLWTDHSDPFDDLQFTVYGLPSAMTYNGLSSADYDEKLREIGNYLWDLEQEADLASAHGNQALVDQIEAKILTQAKRAESFLQIQGDHQVVAAYVAGLGYRMVRRWSEATDHFLSVLEQSPVNGEAWLELTWCLAEQGKWPECEMAARKSTEIFPNTTASWGNLAMALNQLGRTSEAGEAIRRAIELDPNEPRNQEILKAIR